MTNIILLQLSSIDTIIDHWIKLDHFGSIGCFAFSLNLDEKRKIMIIKLY